MDDVRPGILNNIFYCQYGSIITEKCKSLPDLWTHDHSQKAAAALALCGCPVLLKIAVKAQKGLVKGIRVCCIKLILDFKHMVQIRPGALQGRNPQCSFLEYLLLARRLGCWLYERRLATTIHVQLQTHIHLHMHYAHAISYCTGRVLSKQLKHLK